MFVTIAICTWNRADLLDLCLNRMLDLVIPEGVRYEVIVVNNNCTDKTAQILEKYADRMPLVPLMERRQGKSYALNTALNHARGELILWTDDDVLVEANWLKAHVEAAREMPDADFFGGPIRPRFINSPPEWIAEAWQYISGAFAELELGDQPLEFDERTHAFGANFAIRTKVQKQCHYNTRLGRVGDNDIRCEETDLQCRLLRSGHKGYWVPQAGVEHLIPDERLTHDYVRAWQIGIGESMGILKNEGHEVLYHRSFKQLLLHGRLRMASLKYLLSRHLLPSKNWGKYYARIGFLTGRIRQRNQVSQNRIKPVLKESVGEQERQILDPKFGQIKKTTSLPI